MLKLEDKAEISKARAEILKALIKTMLDYVSAEDIKRLVNEAINDQAKELRVKRHLQYVRKQTISLKKAFAGKIGRKQGVITSSNR